MGARVSGVGDSATHRYNDLYLTLILHIGFTPLSTLACRTCVSSRSSVSVLQGSQATAETSSNTAKTVGALGGAPAPAPEPAPRRDSGESSWAHLGGDDGWCGEQRLEAMYDDFSLSLGL